MKEMFSIEIPGGSCRYETTDDGICLCGFGGHIYELVIPDSIDGKHVVSVAKKAFLGAKSLKYVSLPNTVRAIGDYAFSACSLLEDFEIRNGICEDFRWGQNVFSKSNALISLSIWDEISSELSALGTTLMDAQYLLNSASDFYEQFDTRLFTILNKADDEGFVFMVLCGEEDLTADIDEFKEASRKKKAYLCACRLIYDAGLSAKNRECLIDYLKAHTCGCKSEAAFEILVENSEKIEFQDLLFEYEMINNNNFERVLNRLSDRYPVLKSRVICMGTGNDDKVFDELKL